MELQQHHFTIEHRSGKNNANADALSRMYEDEDEEAYECFLMEWENENEESVGAYTYSQTSDYVAPPELRPVDRICLTCGNISGSNTWNRKHYYSYAKENDYNPWICGYTNEPANIRNYDKILEEHFTPPI